MRKVFSIIALIIASALVILMFVTATTYLQLIIAVLLYPVLAYFAIKVFSVNRKIGTTIPLQNSTQTSSVIPSPIVASPAVEESKDSLDLDKRSFLKFVGATSIFFFVSSIFGRFVGNSSLINNMPLINSLPGASPQPVNANTSSSGAIITSGYTITEIDNGIVSYYGFTNKEGGWLIMKEDAETNSFRYAKGTQNFPANWGGRQSLSYDYYYNLF